MAKISASIKSKTLSAINKSDYRKLISILEKIKTAHAGTPKTKDKGFIIYEIIKHVETSPSAQHKKIYFEAGRELSKMTEPVAKELGVSLIWRAYPYRKAEVKKILLQVADHPNWEVREYAAGAFVNTLYHNPDFYKTLVIWSKHKSANVRRAVVFSSLGLLKQGKSKLPKAFALLKPLLCDSAPYVKRNLGPFILGSYFGNKFPDEVFKQFDKWIKIKNPNVRWNLAMSFRSSFGKKHQSKAMKYLKRLSRDENKVVVRAVRSATNFLIRVNSR